MDVSQIKLEFESSKENLLQTVMKNSSNLDASMISEAIKEFAESRNIQYGEKETVGLDFQALRIISKNQEHGL